jgi:membrane-associated phospholipid phosphatase
MDLYYIDVIGFYGPMLIGFINIGALWCRNLYAISYVLFSMLNVLFNGVLKTIIKEQRPSGQIYLNQYDIVPNTVPSRYGMPSGHAQSVGFSVTFLYLVVHSPAMLYVSLFIATITLYQRYKYRRHTIGQLAIGFMVGALFAAISHEITKTYITGKNLSIL